VLRLWVGAALCIGSVACDKQPCNVEPAQCGKGSTCWLKQQPSNTTKDDEPNPFDCLGSGPSKEGEPCDYTIAVPACTDGLTCLVADGADAGTCTRTCSLEHSVQCLPGTTCTYAVLGKNGRLGATVGYGISACIANAADAGTD
jgi:hypothetical protein